MTRIFEGKMSWVKCSDRLPEEEQDYLTYVMDNGCSYRQEVQRFYKNPTRSYEDVTIEYWMKLPEIPKDEK